MLLDEEDVVDNPLPVVVNLEIKQKLRNLLVIEEEIDCCLLQLLPPLDDFVGVLYDTVEQDKTPTVTKTAFSHFFKKLLLTHHPNIS